MPRHSSFAASTMRFSCGKVNGCRSNRSFLLSNVTRSASFTSTKPSRRAALKAERRTLTATFTVPTVTRLARSSRKPVRSAAVMPEMSRLTLPPRNSLNWATTLEYLACVFSPASSSLRVSHPARKSSSLELGSASRLASAKISAMARRARDSTKRPFAPSLAASSN